MICKSSVIYRTMAYSSVRECNGLVVGVAHSHDGLVTHVVANDEQGSSALLDSCQWPPLEPGALANLAEILQSHADEVETEIQAGVLKITATIDGHVFIATALVCDASLNQCWSSEPGLRHMNPQLSSNADEPFVELFSHNTGHSVKERSRILYRLACSALYSACRNEDPRLLFVTGISLGLTHLFKHQAKYIGSISVLRLIEEGMMHDAPPTGSRLKLCCKLGEAYEASGSFEKAAACYKQNVATIIAHREHLEMLTGEPELQSAWNNYGLACKRSGAYAAAERAYRAGLGASANAEDRSATAYSSVQHTILLNLASMYLLMHDNGDETAHPNLCAVLHQLFHHQLVWCRAHTRCHDACGELACGSYFFQLPGGGFKCENPTCGRSWICQHNDLGVVENENQAACTTKGLCISPRFGISPSLRRTNSDHH